MRKRTFKSLLLAGVLMICTAAAALPAMAQSYENETDWNVTFTKDSKMTDNFTDSDFMDIFRRMQPGDDATITLTTTNSHAETTRWYMENEVIHSLETQSANEDTAGGAYTYHLSYFNPDGEEKVLFDSETVGGEDVSEAGEGLQEATDSLDEWLYLDELANGKTGRVVLKVALDGETQGNDYQDTLADLRMRFAVELAETAITGTPTPTATPTGTPGTPTTTTSRRTSVQTGDTNQPILYLVLAGIAGVILLVIAIKSVQIRKRERMGAAGANLPDAKRKGGR